MRAAVELDPMEVAGRLRAARDLSETLAVDAWRAWLVAEHDRVLTLSDADLADRPDLWKWMFPIGGHAHAGSPRIGRRRMRELIDADSGLRAALLRSWSRMLAYLQLQEVDGHVTWTGAPEPWVRDGSHDRRLSRALHCMHSAGLSDEAQSMMAFLEVEAVSRQDAVRWWRHQVAS